MTMMNITKFLCMLSVDVWVEARAQELRVWSATRLMEDSISAGKAVLFTRPDRLVDSVVSEWR